MAGYSKIYCIGGLGGFIGTDGINPLRLQIWQGEGNRQWFECHYLTSEDKPLGKLQRIIPMRPDEPNGLLDACIAFFPAAFKDCPSFNLVANELSEETVLDFNLANDAIPKHWVKLRSEALGPFRQLHIYEAELKKIQPE